MKVYVLMRVWYSDYEVCGVYSSQEKAVIRKIVLEQHTHEGFYDILELTLDADNE